MHADGLCLRSPVLTEALGCAGGAKLVTVDLPRSAFAVWAAGFDDGMTFERALTAAQARSIGSGSCSVPKVASLRNCDISQLVAATEVQTHHLLHGRTDSGLF